MCCICCILIVLVVCVWFVFVILSDFGLVGWGRYMGLFRWIFGGGKEVFCEMLVVCFNLVVIEFDVEMVWEVWDDVDEVIWLF